MFGAILKVTNSFFQKAMTFCRSIYVKKVTKLLAFIFEQPSYQAADKVSCSSTHLHSESVGGESPTSGPSIPSLTLSHLSHSLCSTFSTDAPFSITIKDVIH